MKDQLESLVAPVDDAEVEAALRRVRRRADHRRRTLVVVAGAAAAAVTVVAAVALVDRDRAEEPEPVATEGPPADEQPDGGWPWVTATTAPVPVFDPAELDRVRAEVMERTGEPDVVPYLMTCCNDDGNRIIIELRADAVALAEEFWDRWGPAVEISVGYRRYPTGESTSPGTACGQLEAVDPIPGLDATLTLDRDTVPSGGETRATLVVHNRTDQTIGVAHPKSGDVVVPGGVDRVGLTARAFRLDLQSTDLRPGDSTTVEDIVIGTTSCAPAGPPGTAPGRYEAAVRVDTLFPTQQSLLVRAPLTVGG